MVAARAFAGGAEVVLPRLPSGAQGPIAEAVGTIAYLVASHAREAVRANLAVVAPGREDLTRRVFVNQVRQYLEVFTIPRIAPDRLLATVDVEGWDRFLRAHRAGRGVIFASAHLGPLALVAQIITARGYQLTLPIEPAQSELMRAVNRARGARGMRLVPVDSPLGLHRALRDNGILGVLGDRAVTHVGEHVQLCGRQTFLPSAHVALALHTGAALLPAFAWRDDGGRLHATIEEPLALRTSGDRDADVRHGVALFAALLERYVQRFPDQWTIFEKVWDT